jgi:cell division septation protein DedD
LLMYLKSSRLSIFDSKHISSKNMLKAGNPVIISRNFEIPVTYPYTKNNNAKNLIFEGIDSSLILNKKTDEVKESTLNVSKQKLNKNNIEDPSGNEKNSVFKKSGPSIKVFNNIYKSGNIFIVQVSSWKSESIAINQAKKFQKKGYIPYVEKTLIPGRGEWYRVRIGNFKSLNAAKKFSESY